jgi:hypothetical protein
MAKMQDTEQLTGRWRAAWPQALAVWSRYTHLHDPRLCATTLAAAKEGLHGSFAMIRLADQSVVIDLEAVRKYGLEDYAVEILAHEIGHHVLAPANATDHMRMLARIRRGLPSLEDQAPLVANLYTDLGINDRLQRDKGLRMADIYRALTRTAGPRNPMWTFYMRLYEHLWQLERGALAGNGVTEAIDADAWLGARLVRVYADDWMTGAGRFAALVLPYIAEDAGRLAALRALHDTETAAAGCAPGAVHEVEDDEADAALHPAHDPLVSGEEADGTAPPPAPAHGPGQAREPFEYGAILKGAGIALTDHEIAMRYYRERAQPYLIPFPRRRAPKAGEPLPAAVEPWDIGEPLDRIDWLHSLMLSPRPIPGVTTVQRGVEMEAGDEQAPVPMDLDLYVDSSGSMPDPQVQTSYLALAGAIVALSALRAGASVQATLWSGTGQVTGTDGFVRDADAVLRVITGCFGGATAFPVHRLRDTYAAGPRRRPTHILMISDAGIDTMFANDERGNSGWDVAATALRHARAGGTMALNIPENWVELAQSTYPDPWKTLVRARDEQRWDVHAVADMAQLVAFAAAFSRRRWADAAGTPGRGGRR